MDAVRTGVESAQSTPEIKQQLKTLVNLEQQLNMAKPGLYPLARAAKRAGLWNNTQLAEKYIELCVCYTVECLGRTGTWAERIESMKPPHIKTVREQYSHNTLVGTPSLEDMKMEYCPAIPGKSADIDEVSGRPGPWGLQIYGWSCCF